MLGVAGGGEIAHPATAQHSCHFTAVDCGAIRRATHPHAGLEADLGHDRQEVDAPFRRLALGTHYLVRVRRLREVRGAALVRRQGHRCYVGALRTAKTWRR